jgi:hypothetical protein
MPLLQDSIRFSKTLEASPAQLTSTVREQWAVFKEFHALETKICPFKNLPEARRGQWGEGLTAAKMEKCNWMKPRLVGMIDYLEGTAANHLRHDDRGHHFIASSLLIKTCRGPTPCVLQARGGPS